MEDDGSITKEDTVDALQCGTPRRCSATAGGVVDSGTASEGGHPSFSTPGYADQGLASDGRHQPEDGDRRSVELPTPPIGAGRPIGLPTYDDNKCKAHTLDPKRSGDEHDAEDRGITDTKDPDRADGGSKASSNPTDDQAGRRAEAGRPAEASMTALSAKTDVSTVTHECQVYYPFCLGKEVYPEPEYVSLCEDCKTLSYGIPCCCPNRLPIWRQVFENIFAKSRWEIRINDEAHESLLFFYQYDFDTQLKLAELGELLMSGRGSSIPMCPWKVPISDLPQPKDMIIWLKEAFELSKWRDDAEATDLPPEQTRKLADAYDNWNNPNREVTLCDQKGLLGVGLRCDCLGHANIPGMTFKDVFDHLMWDLRINDEHDCTVIYSDYWTRSRPGYGTKLSKFGHSIKRQGWSIPDGLWQVRLIDLPDYENLVEELKLATRDDYFTALEGWSRTLSNTSTDSYYSAKSLCEDQGLSGGEAVESLAFVQRPQTAARISNKVRRLRVKYCKNPLGETESTAQDSDMSSLDLPDSFAADQGSPARSLRHSRSFLQSPTPISRDQAKFGRMTTSMPNPGRDEVFCKNSLDCDCDWCLKWDPPSKVDPLTPQHQDNCQLASEGQPDGRKSILRDVSWSEDCELSPTFTVMDVCPDCNGKPGIQAADSSEAIEATCKHPCHSASSTPMLVKRKVRFRGADIKGDSFISIDQLATMAQERPLTLPLLKGGNYHDPIAEVEAQRRSAAPTPACTPSVATRLEMENEIHPVAAAIEARLSVTSPAPKTCWLGCCLGRCTCSNVKK